MISKQHIEKFCQPEQGHKTCRYFAENVKDGNFYCLKKTLKKQEMDNELHNKMELFKKQGKEIKDTCLPLGDNCDGLPISQMEQGFDIT